MSDTPNVEDQGVVEESLEELKEYAKSVGLKFHPSISREKLLERIQEAELGDETPVPAVEIPDAEPVPVAERKMTEQQRRAHKRKEANRLVRIQITCMNPNKKAYEGEIFTVSNALVGTFKKYVPFNVPWHVPHIIYKQIVNRKCQIFDTPTNGPVTSRLIPEFAVQVLPPLTEKELEELARRQSMARGV